MKLSELKRCEKVLDFTFVGIYHCNKIHRYSNRVVLVAYGLSTFDFNTLTRLVVAAHDNCVRVELDAGGPRAVKITLHPRTCRKGSMFERHPMIDEAIAATQSEYFPRNIVTEEQLAAEASEPELPATEYEKERE